MRRTMPLALAIAVLFLFASRPATAEDTPSADSLVDVSLRDGTTVRGAIVSRDTAGIVLRMENGVEMRAPASAVTSVDPVPEGAPRMGSPDRNSSRLLFAPTGRPLRRGTGYFSDVYVFFPGVAYGLTDNVSVLAGMSLFPAVGFGDQMKFVAPRIGFDRGDAALSVGTLYARAGGEGAGIAFASGTYGRPDRSVTAVLGFPYVGEGDFADGFIVVLGGSLRIARNASLVTENWVVTAEDETGQLYSLAVRLHGDRLAADLGLLFNGEIIEAGVPLPWVTVTYNFGR